MNIKDLKTIDYRLFKTENHKMCKQYRDTGRIERQRIHRLYMAEDIHLLGI